ncbi:uncharacterized protein LOC105356899 [Oryzias latipes]|uniref:uncharacterized protein LOC105356899 n=1 Tax=Oryzias latipes TaxID=8090 RepID=UPI0005CC8782|nr:uncharacterized protein LOC105356899 [Oryzias latipes]
MLLCFLFIFFVFKGSVKSQSTTIRTSQSTETTTTAASTIREQQPGVQLLASPDYPVLAGQRVHLQCKSLIVSRVDVDWSWQILKGQTWKEVDSDEELILTKPEQSGVYRCKPKSGSNWSQNHTVSIVARNTSMGESLGIAAFILSLLILIIIIAALLLVVCQRIRSPKTPSSPAVKVDPGPKVVPKGGCPTDESDGDVYINYTAGKNSDYTDLDPSSMSADNVYSTA